MSTALYFDNLFLVDITLAYERKRNRTIERKMDKDQPDSPLPTTPEDEVSKKLGITGCAEISELFGDVLSEFEGSYGNRPYSKKVIQ